MRKYEEVSVSLENNEEKHLNSNHPLLASITTDGANVLRGKRSGVSARLRSLCNKLLLYSHCVSHRCQLELKKTAKNECELCKDVNQFLESLFVFHKTSCVVTNTYRQSVNELGIRGASSVIRVNGTRWIAHTLNALINLLNGLPAHIYCCEKLRDSDDYSAPQKAKCRYFLKKLGDKKFVSFMIYMCDVLETASVFSKVSQTRQITISEMEDVLNLTLANVGQFIEDPGRGKFWKSRDKWQIQPEDEISIEYRRKFATAIKANFGARCGSDFPPAFYEAMELINPSKWNHEEIFQFDAQSRSIFCKYKPTDFLDKNIELLTSDAFIRRQLEHQDVEVDVIKSEWISLESILSRWDRNEFSTFENKKEGDTNLSWAMIGKKVTGHDNLFGLIDYFLCQNVSSAEAERGFSILKETKTPRRAILSNNYLSNQMRIMLSETLMTSFEYDRAIDVW